MPERCTIDAALDALADGATLVTGNVRLSRRLLGDEALRARAGGSSVWRSGDVLPWQAWLARLHGDALAGGVLCTARRRVLLSAAQVEACWQQVVHRDLARDPAHRHGLLQPELAARHAADAHALCLAWRVARGAIASGRHHEDVAAFLRWWDAFEAELDAHGWLHSGELADCAVAWFGDTTSLRPRALYLAGFEEYTPQQRALIDALEALSVPVREIEAPRCPGAQVGRVAALDADDEIRRAVGWARARLAAEPAARLGIIVRDLQQRREALARALDAALDPPATREPGRRLHRPWNVSLGPNLADEPLVADALLLIEAAGGHLSFDVASRLLRSPFIAGAEDERDARLRVERELRRRGGERMGTAWVAGMRRRADDAPLAPGFEAACARMLERAAAMTRRAPPEAWAEHFAGLLEAAGWPGQRGLDSHEFQVLQQWQSLLGEFAALGAVFGAVDAGTALSRLRHLLVSRPFQPHRSPAAVQVLGQLEAIDQRFDALWIMGWHDEVWPESPRPNPFLPLRVQRERGLPHATAARELEFAERLGARLMAAAPEVIVSWPARDGDRPLRPSPLIVDLPEVEVSGAHSRDTDPAPLEPFDDFAGTPLDTDGHVAGGVALFSDHSRCTFRGYALHRLKAEALDTPGDGIDPMTTGTLVHAVLERLWRDLGDQATLAALAPSARQARVADAVDAALAGLEARIPVRPNARLLREERARLMKLIDGWLDRELERSAFRVVDRERDVTVSVRGLTVRGRIDRIDALPDGRRLLIDYKTGSPSPAHWYGERPQDPQLPLYALSGEGGDTLAGLLFARVRVHQCEWLGVTRERGIVEGVRIAGDSGRGGAPDWDTLHTQWVAMAERLAALIMAGRADVDPERDTCRYCHLGALCRVEEIIGIVPGEGADDPVATSGGMPAGHRRRTSGGDA